MQDPSIKGVGYQQGTLEGYEVREYLLEKFDRTCAYCGATGVPLQIEHIQPRSRGGSDRISNLALACQPCNQKKGSRPLNEFLAGKPTRLKKVMAQTKRPLKDAAAVNATRNKLVRVLAQTGLPLEEGAAFQTKYNRCRQKYPKAHWIDAACVGSDGIDIKLDTTLKPLQIKAMGHGKRKMAQTDKFGFPKRHRERVKGYFGFKTGDIASAKVPRGKYAGYHKLGRVTVKKAGNFGFKTPSGLLSFKWVYLTRIHKNDGYNYNFS